MLPDFHPFLPFLIAAALAAVTRGWFRSLIMLAAPVVGGLHLLQAEPGTLVQMQVLDLDVMMKNTQFMPWARFGSSSV